MTAAHDATDAAPRDYLAAEVWLRTRSGLGPADLRGDRNEARDQPPEAPEVGPVAQTIAMTHDTSASSWSCRGRRRNAVQTATGSRVGACFPAAAAAFAKCASVKL